MKLEWFGIFDCPITGAAFWEGGVNGKSYTRCEGGGWFAGHTPAPADVAALLEGSLPYSMKQAIWRGEWV